MTSLIERLRRLRSDTSGGMATMFALSLVPMTMFIAAAVEYSSANSARAGLQAAVDSAALAAWSSPTLQRATSAGQYFQANAAARGGLLQNATASWSNNSDGTLTGSASATYQGAMLGVLGLGSIPIHATATVGPGGGGANAVCLLALDPSSAQSLLVNTGVTINAPSCEIDAASQGAPAAIFNAGDSFTVSKICVQGTNVLQNGGTVAALKTGCTTASNPFSSSLPAVTVGSCSVSNQNYTGNNILYPGVYCGTFNFNGSGTLSLQPGLYVFTGANWNLNSGWNVSGAGVTFYFADSNSYIQANSGVTLNLSAPTSGTYSGILMFEPNGLTTSAYTIDGTAGHALSGLIYQPSRNITFNAQSNVSSEALTIVVNQIILNSLTWTLAPATGLRISAASSTGSARLLN